MAEQNPTHYPSLLVVSTGTLSRPSVEKEQIVSRDLTSLSTATYEDTTTNGTANFNGTVLLPDASTIDGGVYDVVGGDAGSNYLQSASALCSTGTNVITFGTAFGSAPDAVASYLSPVSTGIASLTIMGTTATQVQIRTAFTSTGFVRYFAFGDRA